MSKFYLIVMLLVPCSYASMAQNKDHKTMIQANIGLAAFNNATTERAGKRAVPVTVGLAVTRKLVGNISLQLAYERWMGDVSVVSKDWRNKDSIGSHDRHNAIDLSALYNLHFKQHTIYGGIGPSFMWGRDQIVVPFTTVFNGVPMYDVTTRRENGSHFGGHATVGYNYALLHNRMSIGAQFKVRAVATELVQYGGGINVGFHLKK